jgi:hypothetical protein
MRLWVANDAKGTPIEPPNQLRTSAPLLDSTLRLLKLSGTMRHAKDERHD